MLGPNLLIADLPAVLRSTYLTDDFGLDAVSAGNVAGFLMEAYDKRLIDRRFVDGLDFTWGNVDAVHQLLRKIVDREGIGEAASQGVRHLAGLIGQDSHKFAIHSKGQEFAAWNCHPRPTRALGYATANRGACHLRGETVEEQHARALNDSTGVCLFVQGGYGDDAVPEALRAVTGFDWTPDEYRKAGERIFNLEKCFNYREGFRREDDQVPDRFFEEPFTAGPKKAAVIDRDAFENLKTAFYVERGWDPKTTCPSATTLDRLGLTFAKPG
jgi:aldehyde:ferredoxin oxidoreductase